MELKAFEDVVKYREGGKEHNAIVVAVKNGGLVDVVFAQQLYAADGKTPLNVVGSSRQAELVQFRHDLKPEQYSVVEDWFFGLDDPSLDALLKERVRRQHEADQAVQAAASQQAEKSRLEGVVIKPSQQVIDKARELWLADIHEHDHVGEHDEVELPDYAKQPKLWDPWIEKAKAAFSQPVEPQSEIPPVVN